MNEGMVKNKHAKARCNSQQRRNKRRKSPWVIGPQESRPSHTHRWRNRDLFPIIGTARCGPCFRAAGVLSSFQDQNSSALERYLKTTAGDIVTRRPMPRERVGRERERERRPPSRWRRFIDALQSNQNFEYLYWLQVSTVACALTFGQH